MDASEATPLLSDSAPRVPPPETQNEGPWHRFEAKIFWTLPRLLSLCLSLACLLFFARWWLPALSVPPEPPRRPSSRHVVTHVSPRTHRFVDRHGRTVFFRGLNVVYKARPFHPDIDRFHPNTSFSEEDVDILADLGLNVIRLAVMWPGAEPERGKWNNTYFDVLKTIVERCRKADISVLLEFHQDNFGPDFCGEGFPSWLPRSSATRSTSWRSFPFPIESPWPSGDPRFRNCSARDDWAKYQLSWATSRAFQDVYGDVGGALDLFRRFWTKVASEFRSFDNILGYELINEAWVGNIFNDPTLLLPGVADAVNLQPLQQTVASAVLAGDPDALVFFGHVPFDNLWTGLFRTPAAPKRSVLAFHYYSRSLGGPDLFSLPHVLSQRAWDAARLHCGLFLSEFDVGFYEGNMTGLAERLRALDAAGMSWTGYSYKPFIPITGWGDSLIDMRTGKVRPAMAKVFSRAWPRAVAGTGVAFSFVEERAAFRLAFDADPTVSEPTVVYVSRKHWYPRGFRVDVVPAHAASVEVKQRGGGASLVEVRFRRGKVRTGEKVEVLIAPRK
ncbi:glycoside hydrolase superfamily [Hyaloraphidium curvatum]|nr:glycoside hydrolase superfamily [Hyaloraphidium curvatum]